jgi:hypothetical protein
MADQQNDVGGEFAEVWLSKLANAKEPRIREWVKWVNGLGPEDRAKVMADLRPRPGESEKDWLARAQGGVDAHPGWAWERNGQGRVGQYFGGSGAGGSFTPEEWAKYGGLFRENNTGGVGAVGQQKSPGMDYDAAIAEFIRELQQPLNPADPHVQVLIRQARGSADQSAYQRGMDPSWNNRLSQEAELQTMMGLEGQRRDRLQSALGLGSGRDVGLQGLGFEKERFHTGLMQDAADRAHAQRQAQMQAAWGLVGGMYGGAAGAAGLGGMTMGQGVQYGSQFGAGLGGLAAGGSTGPSAYRGLGNTGRGGNY